ncbi:MAG: NTP transferase domain-containing protein [Candidatus Diapherotrites archaeon]|uniref:NTP transferase domain-containing protein n=1 Tax=Candidatus Iainarchaeum sp. TaxID=3101447 RepID=A0A8T4L6G4_9ARCH|nr:NTP transferase domain-containing protein [Candidatus Diapherotrites archaeon]
MQAIILSAGLGTRMGLLTKDKPKALVELGAKPLLGHVLDSLNSAGCTHAIVIIGKYGKKVKDFYANQYNNIKIDYIEQKEQLGTGHALLQARDKAAGEFVVGQCDVIANPATWKRLWKTKGFDCVMTLRKEQEPEKYGVAVVQDKLVAEIVEKPVEPPSDLVNAGCYKFSRRVFDELLRIEKSPRGEYELTDAIKRMIKNKKVGFVLETGKIFDIGNPEELADAEEEIGQEEIKW